MNTFNKTTDINYKLTIFFLAAALTLAPGCEGFNSLMNADGTPATSNNNTPDSTDNTENPDSALPEAGTTLRLENSEGADTSLPVISASDKVGLDLDNDGVIDIYFGTVSAGVITVYMTSADQDNQTSPWYLILPETEGGVVQISDNPDADSAATLGLNSAGQAIGLDSDGDGMTDVYKDGLDETEPTADDLDIPLLISSSTQTLSAVGDALNLVNYAYAIVPTGNTPPGPGDFSASASLLSGWTLSGFAEGGNDLYVIVQSSADVWQMETNATLFQVYLDSTDPVGPAFDATTPFEKRRPFSADVNWMAATDASTSDGFSLQYRISYSLSTDAPPDPYTGGTEVSAWGSHSSPVTLSGLTPATEYRVTLAVRDAAGNTSSVSQNVTTTTFDALDDGSIDVADYDGDGDLDILACGTNINNNHLTYIYRNNGSGYDVLGTAEHGITNLTLCEMRWVNVDDLFPLDIAAVGNGSGSSQAMVYINDGSGYSGVSLGAVGVNVSRHQNNLAFFNKTSTEPFTIVYSGVDNGGLSFISPPITVAANGTLNALTQLTASGSSIGQYLFSSLLAYKNDSQVNHILLTGESMGLDIGSFVDVTTTFDRNNSLTGPGVFGSTKSVMVRTDLDGNGTENELVTVGCFTETCSEPAAVEVRVNSISATGVISTNSSFNFIDPVPGANQISGSLAMLVRDMNNSGFPQIIVTGKRDVAFTMVLFNNGVGDFNYDPGGDVSVGLPDVYNGDIQFSGDSDLDSNLELIISGTKTGTSEPVTAIYEWSPGAAGAFVLMTQ